ncbi:MAG: hypothetical protein JXR06_02170 [Candidatus Atelocyanobacterium thalassa]
MINLGRARWRILVDIVSSRKGKKSLKPIIIALHFVNICSCCSHNSVTGYRSPLADAQSL